MRVFITGGVGFIASYIAEYYIKQDEDNQIYVVDSLYKDNFINKGKSKYYIKKYLEKYDNVTFINRDIRNEKEMYELLKILQPEIIFHTAAQVTVTKSISDPYNDYNINTHATVSLLESIRKLNINTTLIFCSTNKVYGDNVNKKEIIEKENRYVYKDCNGITEIDNIDNTIHTPYGASKLCADLYIQEYGHTYGLKTGIFRMSCIYGPRQMGYEEHGWITHLIISALRNQTIKIFGNGKQVRDILYVSDLVNAYDLFVKKVDQLGNKVYNIGGGMENNVSLLELIKILENVLRRDIKYEFYTWRLADQKVYISDINKVSSELDWKPIISPKNGIEKVIEYFRLFYNK